jgi:ferredoxin
MNEFNIIIQYTCHICSSFWRKRQRISERRRRYSFTFSSHRHRIRRYYISYYCNLGACEGSLACSTCHVILEENVYSQLHEPTDEENDMLDLAFGLTDTSRLGCQVKVVESLKNMKIRLPKATRNMAVDGYKPKHH